MKSNEAELREEIAKNGPFIIVTTAGERIKVRSHDHIFLPPLEDENGAALDDLERPSMFTVWSNGRSYRRIAFGAITNFEGVERIG